MTYLEYAQRNIEEMSRQSPSPQNMRDLALLTLWVKNQESVSEVREEEATKELSDIFPALTKYQKEHTEENLKRLCAEVGEFCSEIYASTKNDIERNIFSKMLDRLGKI